jgi:hypothetical protein
VGGSEELHMTVHLYACIIGQYAIESRNTWREKGKMAVKVCHCPAERGIGALTG